MNLKLELIKKKYNEIREWVLTHGKIIMPLLVVVCVLITVLISLSANKHERLVEEAANTEVQPSAEVADLNVITTPVYTLEENAHPEINDLVNRYYVAQANGDVDTVSEYNNYLNDIGLLRIKQLSQYIEKYTDINVYTKPGLTDGAFVTYVCSKVKFTDMETPIPGMQTYYVEADPEGNYSITEGTYDDNIYSYIKEVTTQDDVVDLNNKVVVEFNDVMEQNAELNDYVVFVKGKINEEVGEMLAQSEAPENVVVEEEKETDNSNVATIVTKVKVKERVNIRVSDSKDSDKVGTASAGSVYPLVQKKDNGWTEIEYEGKSAYINSDYLEEISEVTLEVADASSSITQDSTGNTDVVTNTDTQVNESTKVKTKGSNVRIRKEANTTSDILATLSDGTELEFVEKTGDWTKIKYNGNEGFIKSNLLK